MKQMAVSLVRVLLVVVLAAVAVPSVGARAATITTNGDGTFTDNVTGFVWVDISTFYGATHDQTLALVPSGFSFATLDQVSALAADTGITPSITSAEFDAISAAMGVPQPSPYIGGVPQQIIWGRFDDTGVGTDPTRDGYAFVWGPDSGVADIGNWVERIDITTNTVSWPGMGAFVVNTSVATTPLPAALPLFATGLAGLGLLGWRRKRKAHAASAAA
jgi:hypothetical protein